MRVGTFNAHDNPHAVARACRHAGLLLLQEAPLQLNRALPARWAYAEGRAGVATTWRTEHWSHVSSKWHRAHPGRRLVTPTRGTLETRLTHRASGLPVTVLNSHRINGTGWPGVRRRPFARWRRRRWLEHARLDAQLARQLDDAGVRLIIGGGDWNRRDTWLPHPAGRWLHHAGIDQLWTLDRGGRLEAGQLDTIDGLGSDHALRRRVLTLRAL